MVKACSEAGVQLMDGTMWMHNPRALHMRSVLDDARAVGRLRTVTSSFAFSGRPPPHTALAEAAVTMRAPTDCAHAMMPYSPPCILLHACGSCTAPRRKCFWHNMLGEIRGTDSSRDDSTSSGGAVRDCLCPCY